MNSKKQNTIKPVRTKAWLNRMAKKAYIVGTDAARMEQGQGYEMTWEEVMPSGKTGYIAMVKWIDEQVRSNT